MVFSQGFDDDNNINMTDNNTTNTDIDPIDPINPIDSIVSIKTIDMLINNNQMLTGSNNNNVIGNNIANRYQLHRLYRLCQFYQLY